MKGEILYRILNSIGNQLHDQMDFTNAVLQAGYGATGRKVNYEFSKIQEKRLKLKANKSETQKFKKYLSKLKSDGLILENASKEIYLSKEGKNKLNGFKNSPLLNKEEYRKETGDKVIVISYDIPIIFNRERNILRNLLNMLGLTLIHKSVWIGKVKLPERFIRDLKRLGIIDYVEILEVTKEGTLKSRN